MSTIHLDCKSDINRKVLFLNLIGKKLKISILKKTAAASNPFFTVSFVNKLAKGDNVRNYYVFQL